VTPHEGPRAPRAGDPGRLSYFALLASSTLASLSSTIISAPLNRIADSLGASANEIVLALSVFTVSLVVFSPFAGWLCDRVGTTRALTGGLLVMALVQAVSSLSPNVWYLVLMRVLLGAGCSVIPPAVQRALAYFWSHRRRRAMAAWASSIGVGQALGPPLGGLIADALDWRAVFWVHGVLCLLLSVLIMVTVPRVVSGRPPLHLSGLATLVLGIGSLAVALACAGAGLATESVLLLLALGAVALALHALLSVRSEHPMIPLRLVTEHRFLRATFGAAAVMGTLGVVIVAIPLHLGREYGLSPASIGFAMLGLAGAMTLFAPIASRIGERITPRLAVLGGMALMAAAMGVLALAAWAGKDVTAEFSVTVIIISLVLAGCALGAVQAICGYAVMRTGAAQHGAALGLHNMLRFSGLVAGYAWASFTLAQWGLSIVYLGPAAVGVIGAAFFLGPSREPVSRLEPQGEPG
jgi:MFS family permease